MKRLKATTSVNNIEITQEDGQLIKSFVSITSNKAEISALEKVHQSIKEGVTDFDYFQQILKAAGFKVTFEN